MKQSIVEKLVARLREARRRVTRTLSAAVVVGTLLPVIAVAPSFAQLATISFPDTAVGSIATIKCPDTNVSICFGENCSGPGTVQSVTGPSAPFSVVKFNRLSNAEFFGGQCEAHPVTLPVTLAAGQILAYQAVFAPTAVGTFNGSLTFNTPGGPATINLTGKGTASGPTSPGLGLVTITSIPDRAVPGNRVEISYAISRESLTGPVDLYAAVVVPGSGQWLFLNESGGATTTMAPLRRNLPPADTAATLFQDVAVDAPYGTYTFLMALIQAGKQPSVDTLASPVADATLIFTALSAVQQTTLQQRGNPDAYSMFWIDELHQKREVWIYLSPQPVELVFVNGALESTTTLPNRPAVGPVKVDPGLFTPQTTRAAVVAAFGNPSSQTDVEGFTRMTFSPGLDMVFNGNRLVTVSADAP